MLCFIYDISISKFDKNTAFKGAASKWAIFMCNHSNSKMVSCVTFSYKKSLCSTLVYVYTIK